MKKINGNSRYMAVLVFSFFVSFSALLAADRTEHFSPKSAGDVSAFSLPSDRALLQAVLPVNDTLRAIRRLPEQQALPRLMNYLKQKARKRFYFDWQNVRQRVRQYVQSFPQAGKLHVKRAAELMQTFPADVPWQRPLRDLTGKNVSAYAFRHLIRQSKMPDVALTYYLKNNDKKYMNYFVGQVRSLQEANRKGKVESGGNAVFEVFRAGKRVQHWLFCHYLFLASNDYTWQDQLLLMRLLLWHGEVLFAQTQKLHPGNHQTRGLTALFELAALFPEFKPAARWRQHAINGLLWHIEHEVNTDGFQFERSEHYHKGDIENYLRVYQLARLNGIELPALFKNKFQSMFEALVKLALPDGKLPVLQDDTDGGSDVEADLSEPMALGAILFRNPAYRYFAADRWPQTYYWLLRQKQLSEFFRLPKTKPRLGSIALRQTGYYVMRDGWQPDDHYLLISAGLQKKKPDHQHGDMLGIIAYAGGTMFLPNYKVHYNRPDYSYLKNSWAKNVALVDSQVQGQIWLANRGGSGFGKWKELPQPRVLCWQPGEKIDYFSGTHNGFVKRNVKYDRTVFFIKHGFWLVRDRFQAAGRHTYQQVWQGALRQVSNRRLQRVLANGKTASILQLGAQPFTVIRHTFTGHHNTVFQIKQKGNFTFFTLITDGNIRRLSESVVQCADYLIEMRPELALSDRVAFLLKGVIRRGEMPAVLISVHGMLFNGKKITFAQPVDFQVLNVTGKTIKMKIWGTGPARLKDLGPFLVEKGGKATCGSVVLLHL